MCHILLARASGINHFSLRVVENKVLPAAITSRAIAILQAIRPLPLNESSKVPFPIMLTYSSNNKNKCQLYHQ